MASRIVFLSLFIYLSLAASGPPGDVAFAQQEFFPFLAEVTGDRVNVRSGQSANFERLCQIDKGEEIVVEGKEFSWYKVRLPSSAKSFVSKKYVQFLGQNAGGVIADRVNIRAGAGTHYTILGQLNRGEQIFIQEELDGWYRIRPVTKSYGWVMDRFLTFKSRDIIVYQSVVIPPKDPIKVVQEPQVSQEQQTVKQSEEPEDPRETQKPPAEKKVKQPVPSKKIARAVKVEAVEEIEKIKKPKEIKRIKKAKKIRKAKKAKRVKKAKKVKKIKKIKKVGELVKAEKAKEAAKPKAKEIKSLSAVGYVKLYEREGDDGVYYKIVTDGKPACYIQGLNHMLGRFLHHKVMVEGVVSQDLRSQYDSPVIVVSKVKLVL